jgi:uncharacterized protein YicC (UPF0701 family)
MSSSQETSASSIDVLTEGLKRSIAPKMRKLDASMATAQWTQREVVDGIDRCSLAVEEVLRVNASSSASIDDDDDKRGGEEKGKDQKQRELYHPQTEEGKEDDATIERRLTKLLESVTRVSERYAKVLERERAQREKLEKTRRCDLDIVRANRGEECDFQAVLRTEAYVKRT